MTIDREKQVEAIRAEFSKFIMAARELQAKYYMKAYGLKEDYVPKYGDNKTVVNETAFTFYMGISETMMLLQQTDLMRCIVAELMTVTIGKSLQEKVDEAEKKEQGDGN